MSPRAAWRLESLGFTRVFDYMPGKAEWAAYGLPLEKDSDEPASVGEALERHPPTCSLDDSVETVRRSVQQSPAGVCAVIDAHHVVLGACTLESAARQGSSVEDLMQAGPRTLRPNHPVPDAEELLHKHKEKGVLVTSPDGKLMGLFPVRE